MGDVGEASQPVRRRDQLGMNASREMEVDDGATFEPEQGEWELGMTMVCATSTRPAAARREDPPFPSCSSPGLDWSAPRPGGPTPPGARAQTTATTDSKPPEGRRVSGVTGRPRVGGSPGTSTGSAGSASQPPAGLGFRREGNSTRHHPEASRRGSW